VVAQANYKLESLMIRESHLYLIINHLLQDGKHDKGNRELRLGRGKPFLPLKVNSFNDVWQGYSLYRIVRTQRTVHILPQLTE